MEPILTIDNLNSFGGNMLRQGDKSQLKYRLRDVGNKNLAISGKSCQIRMYGRNYTTVVYETSTSVSSDNTVTFTIDKVLPKGTFYLEFTVGDYIFPTDHKEFFEITPSGKGMESNIIEIVGVDAVVRKAVDLINDDPSLIIDEDKLVTDIINNTEIGSINEYHQQFKDVMKELSAEKDYHSLPEIAGARGGFDTLGERLNNTTAQLAQKVGGNTKAKLTDLSEEVLGAMSGGAEFNLLSIPQDRSVSLNKLGFSEYLPKGFTFNLTGNNTRALSEEITMISGETVRTLGLYSYGLYRLPYSGAPLTEAEWSTTGWLTTDTPVDITGLYVVRLSKVDGSAMNSNELSDMSNSVYITSAETAVKRSELDSKLSNLSASSIEVDLELGSVLAASLTKGPGDITRARAIETPFMLYRGDKLTLEDTVNYEMALATETTGAWIVGWSTTMYESDKDELVAFQIRRKDNGAIDLTDLKGKIIYSPSNRLAKMEDLENFTPPATKVRYVSLAGSDSNSGASQSETFATLQKAINDGAKKIYVKADEYYHQSVSASVDDLEIVVYGQTQSQTNAVFKGADKLESWESSNGVYRTPYTGNNRFNQVFVDKTLPPEVTGTRPTFNAVLWEGDNGEDDYKMKPVLTLAECQAEVGTFFYDGNYVYVNPQNINSIFHAVKTDSGFNITSGNKVSLNHIVFDYYTNNPMRLTNIKELKGYRSKGLHSSVTDGFNLNYSFGQLDLCEGIKNRNDGFNNHYYGAITLNNCKGINNYDDGASPHENCEMHLNGGEYRGNGKGGFSPVNDAQASANNVVFEGNAYSLWHNTNTGNKAVYNNCLFKDNTNGVQATTGGEVVMIGCTEINNGVDNLSGGSKVTRY